MATDDIMYSQQNEGNSSENIEQKPPIPLSDYAKQLEQKINQRYREKIAAIGIDPVLIEGKFFEPDCLPPVESTDLLFYLVLETSYYTKQQFKSFRSLQAYNQMVSGFIASVQGHIINDKFVVLAKVRHSQRMNDSLIQGRTPRLKGSGRFSGQTILRWSLKAYSTIPERST